MFKKSNYQTVIQKKNYDCGVAASYALLLNSGFKTGYKTLERRLRLTKNGVSCARIAEYFKSKKILKPEIKINSDLKHLLGELKKGRICMVVYQSWGKNHEQQALECGHYSLAVRATNTKLYLIDPGAYEDWGDGIGWRIMNLKDFADKWIDKDGGKIVKGWMLSVKPLDKGI